MFAFGSYFVVFIYVMGTILAFVDIDPKVEKRFYRYILKAHNKYRKIHGSHDLVFDTLCSVLAENHLNKMLSLPFNARYLDVCGVNTLSMDFKDVSRLNAKLANEIVKSWYENGANYNYLAVPLNNDADTFTQIVWERTTLLGVKMKMTEEGRLHIVVTYFEKGNIRETYLDLVKKAKKPKNVFGNLFKGLKNKEINLTGF